MLTNYKEGFFFGCTVTKKLAVQKLMACSYLKWFESLKYFIKQANAGA